MPKVFQRKRDKGKRRKFYWFNHVDATGKRRMIKGFTDKSKTEQYAAKLEHEADLRRRGLIDPEQEEIVKRKKTALSEHVDAFKRKVTANTPKYAKLVMSRVRKVVTGCNFVTVADINAEAVETFLRDFVAKKNFGPRTYNHYLQAIQGFSKWLVKSGRATVNPLVSLEPLNSEVDIRHKRRALSPEQVMMLVKSARESGVDIQCFDGEQRARIYLLSYLTGFRKSEIASLTPRSFDLDGDPPTVTVEAAASKNRRRSVLPLHPELVSMLPEWLKGLDDDEPLFPGLAQRRGYLMVRKDLERVGIPYETPDGIADFHAAGRHTHITELLRNGASLPEAKELARHSDIRMTMKYTHIGIEDQAKAIRRLPWHHSGISPRDPSRPVESTRGTSDNSITKANPGDKRTSVASRHDKASTDISESEASGRVRFPPPPLFFETSPSARTSKGFLIVGQRVAPLSVQFDRTISRILRFAA